MEPKPGVKTTEFWLSLLSVLLGAFMGSGLLPGDSPAVRGAGAILAALTALGYSISRGLAKSKPDTLGYSISRDLAKSKPDTPTSSNRVS
jgi:hypothetical protein